MTRDTPVSGQSQDSIRPPLCEPCAGVFALAPPTVASRALPPERIWCSGSFIHEAVDGCCGELLGADGCIHSGK